MKKLLIGLIVILFPSWALANFAVKFENNFSKKMYYRLYWIDHPFNWPVPVNIAGGELDAKESLKLESSYRSGKYRVVWHDGEEWEKGMLINIGNDITQIKVTPEKIDLSKSGG